MLLQSIRRQRSLVCSFASGGRKRPPSSANVSSFKRAAAVRHVMSAPRALAFGIAKRLSEGHSDIGRRKNFSLTLFRVLEAAARSLTAIVAFSFPSPASTLLPVSTATSPFDAA